MKFDARIPSGPLEKKWDKRRQDLKLVNPANKRKFEVIVVGSGLAGGAAAATLGELGQLMQARNAPAEARFYLRRALALRLDLQDIPSAMELAGRLQELETLSGDEAAAETYEKQRKKLESLLTSRDSQL